MYHPDPGLHSKTSEPELVEKGSLRTVAVPTLVLSPGLPERSNGGFQRFPFCILCQMTAECSQW